MSQYNNNKHCLLFNSLNNNNNISFLNQFKSAFSLVELSIVLIIIGLLISAVIGGRALIDEAKIITIRNEFEEYKNALYRYSQDGHSLIYSGSGCSSCFCNSKIFSEMRDLGYINKSQYAYNRGYGAFKSKLKGTSKQYNLWSNQNCYGPSSWGTKKAKAYLYYANVDGRNTDEEYFLTTDFCKKLVRKLRSHYGEDNSVEADKSNVSKAKKYAFYCQCGLGWTNWTECNFGKSTEAKNARANLVVVMFDF